MTYISILSYGKKESFEKIFSENRRDLSSISLGSGLVVSLNDIFKYN